MDAAGGPRHALLVVDLQRDLCLDDRRRELVRPAVANIVRLVDHWSARGLPVFYTKFELNPDDPQFDRFGDRYCIRGTEGAEFIDEILPIRGQVVAKSKHSAFVDTGLEKLLRDAGCDGVVLTGLQTQICILTTAADAYHRGLDVVVVEDAVASTRDDVRLQAIEWIHKYVGTSTDTAKLLET